MLLSGKPKDVYLYQKQLGNISQLRTALENYKRYAGAYPVSHAEMNITIAEAKKLPPQPWSSTTFSYLADYEKEVKVLAIVPKDAFTKQLYGYAKISSDYELRYTIEAPSGPAQGSGGVSGFFGYDPYVDIKV